MKTKLSIRNITNSDNYLIDLLKEKGIKDIDSFLNPTKEFLAPPTDLDGVSDGFFLIQSIGEHETIGIVVD